MNTFITPIASSNNRRLLNEASPTNSMTTMTNTSILSSNSKNTNASRLYAVHAVEPAPVAPVAPPAAPVLSQEEQYNQQIERLRSIIDATDFANHENELRIVNNTSRFVVVTYWWGRGNLNRNLARPCLSFYEDLLTKPFDFLQQLNIPRSSFEGKAIRWIKVLFAPRSSSIRDFYKEKLTDYALERRAVAGDRRARNNANVLTDVKQIGTQFFAVLDRLLTAADPHIRQLLTMPNASPNFTNAMNEVRKLVRTHIMGEGGLVSFMEYRPPKRYNEMIQEWKDTCTRSGCNYLAVEYPDFAMPGGYQLAINAKPMFIRKALERCAPLAVVYIDGDMMMNRYPEIFDMKNVDYMARNWNIDPRSSWKHKHGEIVVDPYTFETSGGIMYFSQTPESHSLLDKWVTESAKFINKGKADDRIISLIFNSYRLLAPMKIVQLPVEFLWLSLDYDDTIADDEKEQERIYVAHPECLTSEDTAASSGAALSRQPKYYAGIENTMPRSEKLYERVMFPNAEMRDNFGPWLRYVGSVEYEDEFVEEELKEDLVGYNPFSVVKMEDGFGDAQAIVDANEEKAANTTNTFNATAPYVILNEESFDIPVILKNLRMGRTIYYKPSGVSESKRAYFEQFIQDTRFSRIEFAFYDTGKRLGPNYVFNYEIDLNQPILLRPGNPVLEMMVSLMENKEKFQNVFKAGFQFLSLIRCYVLKGLKERGAGQLGGGEDRNTEDAIKLLYGARGGAQRHKTRRNHKARVGRKSRTGRR